MQLLNECKKTEKRDFMCVQKTVPKDAYAPLKGVSAYKFWLILKYKD